jgi:cell division protein ZapA (FtsZ GTPase activity inhibitor)
MTELEVDIYGKKYTLRGSSAEEIRAIAKYVDQRMKELFGSEPRAIDQAKTFILAINFAEEICSLKKEEALSTTELNKKLDRFAAKVAQLEKITEM